MPTLNRKITFDLFVKVSKKFLNFREEWTIDEWNIQYANYKTYLKSLSPNYIGCKGTHDLIRIFCLDFYQDVTKETHDYWLKTKYLKKD